MGLSGAVQWWEESQLRILVLASLVIQYVLLVSSIARKFPIRSWFRPVIWLAYLGSDAVAIYALATLFNRHRKPHDDVEGGSKRHSILEVLWAPILLMHLGGQDGITAYNIEDNELWPRHILTTVSQVAVAIYVFCKSWPGGEGDDTILLISAILLFIFGIFKCIDKPLALNRASINSLVNSSEPVQRLIHDHDDLKDFIKEGNSMGFGGLDYHADEATEEDLTPYKLFVDLASPSADDRRRIRYSFSILDPVQVYYRLQYFLSESFQILYTKGKMSSYIPSERPKGFMASWSVETNKKPQGVVAFFGSLLRGSYLFLLIPVVPLFHYSHREAYSKQDVKVTYALLCCTIVLEVFSFSSVGIRRNSQPRGSIAKPEFEDMVSQYNLIELLARNRNHPKMMSIVGVLGCTDFVHQRWRMKSCSSSFSITELVFEYLACGWRNHIKDVSSYRKFNDNRGQLTLQLQKCYQELKWSLEGRFDESVLLWHLATDFCYYDKRSSHHGPRGTQGLCPAWCRRSDHHKRAVQCRQMSNYMMYLLFVNPEMLMAGTRRNLFTTAYNELKCIIVKEKYQPPNELTQRIIAAMGGEGGSPSPDGAQQQPGESIIAVDGEGGPPRPDGTQQQKREITADVAGEGGPLPPDGTQQVQRSIIRDAWSIAKELSGLPEKKMWDVIEGVWLEMMCFSAVRCRGYLHAKGLATGVEYLTYVWLLQYCMGMETLADKLQRVDYDHDSNGGKHGDDPSSSAVSKEATAKEATAELGASSSGTTAQKDADQWSYQSSDATGEEIV